MYLYIFALDNLIDSDCLYVFRKISEHPQRESNPCLPIAGSVVIALDYRVSDSNAMLTRDLVPIVDMCTLCLKSHHICNNRTGNRETRVRFMLGMFRYFSEYTSLRTTFTTLQLYNFISKIHMTIQHSNPAIAS